MLYNGVMTIPQTTDPGGPAAPSATDQWLAEYRQLIRAGSPGMVDLVLMLARAADVITTVPAPAQPLPQRQPMSMAPLPGWPPPDARLHDDPGQAGLSVPQQIRGGGLDDVHRFDGPGDAYRFDGPPQ